MKQKSKKLRKRIGGIVMKIEETITLYALKKENRKLKEKNKQLKKQVKEMKGYFKLK